MKKLLSVFLAFLMVISLASCGGKTPDAKELFVRSYENLTSFGYDMNMDLSMSEGEETIGVSIGLEGEMDANQNMKIKYVIGEQATGMSYSGEAYFMLNDLAFYLQLMGMWLSVDKDDYELLLGDSFNMDEYFKLMQDGPKANAELVDEMGLVFSEVTEEEGIYYFDVSYSDKTIDFIINKMPELYGEQADVTVEELKNSGNMEILKNLKLRMGINKKTTTLASMSCDMTEVLNDFIVAEFASLEGIDSEVEMPEINIGKAAFEATYSDINSVQDIVVPENVKNNAVSIVDFIQAMMMGYGM